MYLLFAVVPFLSGQRNVSAHDVLKGIADDARVRSISGIPRKNGEVTLSGFRSQKQRLQDSGDFGAYVCLCVEQGVKDDRIFREQHEDHKHGIRTDATDSHRGRLTVQNAAAYKSPFVEGAQLYSYSWLQEPNTVHVGIQSPVVPNRPLIAPSGP